MPQIPLLPIRSWLRLLTLCVALAATSLVLLTLWQVKDGGAAPAAREQSRVERLEALFNLRELLTGMRSDLDDPSVPIRSDKWLQQWEYARSLGRKITQGAEVEALLGFDEALQAWQRAIRPLAEPLAGTRSLPAPEREMLRDVQKQWGDPLLSQVHVAYHALSQPALSTGRVSTVVWALMPLNALLMVLAALSVWGIVRSLRQQVGTEPSQLVEVTREIVNGNLTPALKVRDDDRQSVVANIAVMLEHLRSNQNLNQHRLWLDKGLALINDTVRNEYSINDLAHKISENISIYLELQSCALYLYSFGVEDDSMIQRKALRLFGQHARDGSQFPARLAHGLPELQRAAPLGELLRNRDMPAELLDELRTQPQDAASHFLMVPLLFENQMRGTLILKSRYPLPADISDLMTPGSVAIGVAVESALNRETLMASLMDAQRLTNQLQLNHEKLQHSQRALKDNIDYVNDVLSSMHSGLLIVDREGKIRDCNPALQKMAGLNREQLLGQHSSFLFEEDETSLLSVLKGYGQMLTHLALQDLKAYRELISGSMLGCMLVNSMGQIIEANQRAAMITGYSIAELQRMEVSELVPPRHRGRHNDWLPLAHEDENLHRSGSGRQLTLYGRDHKEISVEISLINHQFEGQTVTLTLVRTEQDLPWAVINASTLQQLMPLDEDAMVTRLRHADGHDTPVRITSSFLLDSSGMPQQTVINVHDVSTLVNKSKEIRAQHQLLEMAMDAMQDGVLRVDRQGVVVSANPMAVELLGQQKASVMGARIADLFPGVQHGHSIEHWLPMEFRQLMMRLIEDLSVSPEAAHALPVPLLCLNHQGLLEWATPSACSLLAIHPPPQSSDVPVALAAQTTEQLQGLRERLAIGGDTPQIVDVAWRAGNAPTMRLPTLLIPGGGKTDQHMIVWLIPELDALCAHAIQTAHNIEWLSLHPEGVLIPVLLTASPLLDPYSRLTGAVLTIKDMRELKEKEAENLRMVQKMEQSQRLDALGQLAAGVAHDFNNLLGVIQNHAELVEMKVGPDSKAARNLSAIMQATTRARDIVIKLNGLGREAAPEEGQEEVQSLFELVPLLHETQSLLQASLKGIDILVEPDSKTPGVVMLKGQSGALQQVVVNLCVNGSHAIGERRDGRIIVETHCPEDGFVCIDVVDNGSGIPPEILPRIFEPFFTTKEVGKGTGLGLAMVRSIVTRMGGSIDCQSVVGEGTRFSLKLPCVRQ
jgi:PAS domain S-box-containing protein